MFDILAVELNKSDVISFLPIFKKLIVELSPSHIQQAGFYEFPMESGAYACMFLKGLSTLKQCCTGSIKGGVINPIDGKNKRAGLKLSHRGSKALLRFQPPVSNDF